MFIYFILLLTISSKDTYFSPPPTKSVDSILPYTKMHWTLSYTYFIFLLTTYFFINTLLWTSNDVLSLLKHLYLMFSLMLRLLVIIALGGILLTIYWAISFILYKYFRGILFSLKITCKSIMNLRSPSPSKGLIPSI